MKADSKKVIQAVLLIAMAIALVRVVVIFQQRRAAEEPVAEPPAPALDPDYLVRPRRLYLHDLESAQQQLGGQSVWIREGHRYTFYPHNPRGQRTDFAREAGLLGPLQRLDIQRVLRQPHPGSPGDQVVAVFEKDGATYALPIGTHLGGNYQLYADEVFFYDDPRGLYDHWPPEVWQAIEQGEVRPGMNELQASFAAGMGMPQATDEPGVRLVRYPRDGNPLLVTYRNGRVLEVQEEGAGGG